MNNYLNKSQLSLSKDYYEKNTTLTEQPTYLILEVTNHCNLECIMCPHPTMTRKKGHMDYNLFKKIIDESKSNNIEMIFLHFFGESLLHKDIFKYIDYASHKGIAIGLSTNATMFTPSIVERLLHSKLDFFIVSIDSIQKELYESIRIGAKYENMTAGVKLLLDEHKKNNKLNVVVQMILLETNKNQVNEFIDYFQEYKQKGLNVFIKGATSYANQITDKNIVNQVKSTELESLCLEPWRGITIAWNGDVHPCCMDFDGKINLGDIKVDDISSVWNSPDMINFREQHISGNITDISPCNNCSIPCESEIQSNSMFSAFNPVQYEILSSYLKGIYPYEFSRNGFFWTKKRFELLILDKFNTIQVQFSNFHPTKQTLYLKVSLYGQYIDTYPIQHQTLIELPVIEKYKGRLLRYEFEVDFDWVPKEHNMNDDTRALGVMLENIKN